MSLTSYRFLNGRYGLTSLASVIRINYTRYCYYYKIRRALFLFVNKVMKPMYSCSMRKKLEELVDVFIIAVMGHRIDPRVSITTELQRGSMESIPYSL